MASMKDIKRRKDSITSTQKITNAMKLVATAKLQRAKHNVFKSRPYYRELHSTISSILSSSQGISHRYLTATKEENILYLAITSNRGLAGGYNTNVVRALINNHMERSEEAPMVVAVGRRGKEALKKKGCNILGEYNQIIESPRYKDAVMIADKVIELYETEQVDSVYVVYSEFISTLNQEPREYKLLPLSPEEFASNLEDSENLGVRNNVLMNYEPSAEEVLDYIIPEYISSLIYATLKESAASEHGARMTAMDSATTNASEMIDKLELLYNRARQAAITQEITEIVSGADAL